mgnify:CR=1 FL=1
MTILDTPTDPPGVSINDISVTEGNAGTTNATFTLTFTGPAIAGTTVTYETADGTAHAGGGVGAAAVHAGHRRALGLDVLRALEALRRARAGRLAASIPGAASPVVMVAVDEKFRPVPIFGKKK